MDQKTRSGGRTTAEIRLAIQESQESIRALAERYGVNPKTVAKWRARPSVEDRRTGPHNPKSTVLSPEQEAIIVAFRRFSRLPLDDCFYVLAGYIPGLTRSSLHRCLRRHGISRLDAADDEAPSAGCFDIHVIDPAPGSRGHHFFLAVDRASKFAFADLLPAATLATAAEFLGALVASAPVAVSTVVTEPCAPFTAAVAGRTDPFSQACVAAGVEHRPTAPDWSPDQLDRMDRTIRDATRRRMGGREAESRLQLADVIAAYNSGCRFKALGGLTPLAFLRRTPAPPPPPRRAAPPRSGVARTRNPVGTREAILQAAGCRLALDGPERLSLSEAARAAGVNRGTAYQHFETREKLVAATTAWVSDQLFEAVFGDAAVAAGGDVIDRLTRCAMDMPELCRAWLLQLMASPDLARDRFWRAFASAQPGPDAEASSLMMLAGACVLPAWARARSPAGADLDSFAARFAQSARRL